MSLQYLKHKALFQDAYDYASQIEQGSIQHYQLEPGQFYGELCQIVSKPIIISTHRMNISVLQYGPSQKGYTTFLIPGNLLDDFSWRKQSLSGKHIGILKSGMLHFAVIPSRFYGTPISLSNDYFNELIIRHGYDEKLYKFIQKSEAIELDIRDAFHIQEVIINLCQSNKIDSNILIKELPIMLLKAIENASDGLTKSIQKSSSQKLGVALEYINKNLDQRLTVNDICSVAEISERNLRYIFEHKIGLAPKKYIKTLKLNKVRKDIIKNNNRLAISFIASKWGFNHSGQFAADYKRLFREYPSETQA